MRLIFQKVLSKERDERLMHIPENGDDEDVIYRFSEAVENGKKLVAEIVVEDNKRLLVIRTADIDEQPQAKKKRWLFM